MEFQAAFGQLSDSASALVAFTVGSTCDSQSAIVNANMRTLLLGDIGNRLDIADAERSVSALRQSQQRTAKNQHARDRQIETLKDEVERQKLAIQALTRFLIQKDLIDDLELREFIEAVDAEDGIMDGKMSIDTSGKPRLVFSSNNRIPEGISKVAKKSSKSLS